ncbi:MAG TPA: hypothetical protein VF395_14805, partial [Polyangiaceae bacterium]
MTESFDLWTFGCPADDGAGGLETPPTTGVTGGEGMVPSAAAVDTSGGGATTGSAGFSPVAAAAIFDAGSAPAFD